VLSKPLGTGLALASGDDGVVAAAVASMRRLNRAAADILRQTPEQVHAVTDVTGFGLLGHGWEMASRSNATLEFDAELLPLLDSVRDLAASGVRTGGDARNRDYAGDHVTITADDAAAAIGFDPQTSGGLLAAVEPSAADRLVDHGFCEIGRVLGGPAAVSLR
jgi:selenide,water dikinase